LFLFIKGLAFAAPVKRRNDGRIGHSSTVSQPKKWQIRVFASFDECNPFVAICLAKYFDLRNEKSKTENAALDALAIGAFRAEDIRIECVCSGPEIKLAECSN
jgi:hypothetical protein